MDEQLQRQIVRQLKFLNFWVSLFGAMMIITLIIVGILMFKLVSYVRDTAQKVETFQQETKEAVDLKKQVCDDDKLGNLLEKRTEVCD